MRNFKKRTIALILASVVTVAGSFAEENFKNTLMDIDFLYAKNGSGALSLVVKTKNQYTGNVIPTKKDDNTYILMLPEVNSKAMLPDITKYNGYIEKITINTLPYTTSGNGYTRIVVKTNNVPFMHGQNMLYIPSKEDIDARQREIERQRNEELLKKEEEQLAEQRKIAEQKRIAEQRRIAEQKRIEEEQRLLSESQKETQQAAETAQKEIKTTENENINDSTNYINSEVENSKSAEGFLLILGVLLIIACSVYLYIKAKDKLRDIAGESLQIDVDEPKEKKTKKEKKEKKSEKIKNTIKTLDATYSKTAVPKKTTYEPIPQKAQEQFEEIEEINVVDLDELFKEKINTSQNQESTDDEEENLALEEFLNGFSFDEETYENIELETEVGYDAEYYDKLLSSEDVTFSKDDAERISKLLNTEISDYTLQELENYLISNPIKRKRSKKEILEEFVTTYAISQNIIFTQNDVSILEKLINVEIDLDFVNDLRTSSERTAKMEEEIVKTTTTPKKPPNNAMLNVKDLLPDLSEALKKQGNKEIKSEVKPTTVYFSKGYDVKTLSVDVNLPDLSKEINKKSAYTSKPSASYDLVDNSYQVERLSLTDELPDLKDVMAHPEKYQEEKVEEVVVDENALLNNISNVSFKPFYDGTQEFEVLNNIEEMNKTAQEQEKEIITDNEPIANEITTESKAEKTSSEPLVKLNRTINRPAKKERKSINSEVLKKIEERRKQPVIEKKIQKKDPMPIKEEKSVTEDNIQCIVEGESFKVISSTKFTENTGCYLTKNDRGYTVLGYIGDKTSKIKEYTELKSEKIQSRKNETLDNGEERYIVRIGINKFLVSVSTNDIKYIMDLC